MQFYRHSGRCGVWGVPLASAVGIVAALVLSLAYVYVVNWIPLIYVAFLATAAFGAGIGAAVAYGARIGKMRNMPIATVLAGVVGILAMYFAWAFDPMARFSEISRPLWDIETLWIYMQLGYQQGFWSLGRGGGPVTGVFLAVVWIVEAGLVVGIACYTLRYLLGEQPFCEETQQWTKTEKDIPSLSLVNDENVEWKLERLLAGEVDVLEQFYRAAGDEPAMLQLSLASCPDCSTCNYLTAKTITQVANKKGEITPEESKILVNLQIAPEQVARVRTAGCDRPTEVDDSEAERDAIGQGEVGMVGEA